MTNTFDESRHPRGHAGNAGQFAPKLNTAPGEPLAQKDIPRRRRGASLGRGDFGGYALSKVQKMQGREGEAFSAVLTLDRKVVGEIRQDGNGGDTWIRPSGPGDRENLMRFIAEHWDFQQRYISGGREVLTPHTMESFADAIYMEHDMRKRLDRGRKAGRLAIIDGQSLIELEETDAILSYSEVRGGVGNASDVKAALSAQDNLTEQARYWDGETWASFSDLA